MNREPQHAIDGRAWGPLSCQGGRAKPDAQFDHLRREMSLVAAPALEAKLTTAFAAQQRKEGCRRHRLAGMIGKRSPRVCCGRQRRAWLRG